MTNYDNVTIERRSKYNLKWPEIPGHSYRILMIEGSGSDKKTHYDDYCIIGETYLYLKDPNKAKYQYVIWKRENNGLKNVKDSKTFIEYSNNMQDVPKNIEE